MNQSLTLMRVISVIKVDRIARSVANMAPRVPATHVL